MEHLILNLESPLMSFGGEAIDNLGITRRFPSVSMLTGLLANALGWRREDKDWHQRLQDRLIFAARIDREPANGLHITDFQTAAINRRERGWTTLGVQEGRDGGEYRTHLRYRDYYSDMRVTLAVRLDPEDDAPTLEALAEALETPARPLFIGRKTCLPSGHIYQGRAEASSALTALLDLAIEDPQTPEDVHLMWPEGETDNRIKPEHSYMLTDQRDWISGLHGGGRLVHEGAQAGPAFPDYIANAIQTEGQRC